jgi:Zn-dependent metalloprotease/subtilisin-like proprotein convertase family protein
MSFTRGFCIVLSTLLIASGLSWAKRAPQGQIPGRQIQTQTWNGSAEALASRSDDEGFATRIYYPAFSSDNKKPDRIVDDFLREYSSALGIDPADLKLMNSRKSLGAMHYRYQQFYHGIPVFASQVLVNITFDGVVSSVISDYRRNIDVPSQPSISAAGAIEIAADKVAVESFRGDPDSELVVYVSDGMASLCWRILLPAETPLGDWQVFVDAASGAIVDIRNIMVFVDGSGYVFDPNPVVSERTLNLPDSTDGDYEALTNARFDVVLEDLDPAQGGYYYLSGPYVNTSPTSNRAHETDPDSFHYNRQNDWFEEVVVYYHLNTCHSFYESLGFNNIMNFSISADVNGTTQDNSWYSPGNRQLTFGSGGVDDAEDADVIVHEYGHATQFDQVPDWGQTHEGGSMGEGFGDYLSVAYAHPVFNDWDEAQVFDWDLGPVEHFWPGRRVDEDKHYPDDMQGEVHADGEIWSRCLWDIQNSIAYDTTAQLVLESHFYLTGYAEFIDGANAIIEADINLYSGAHLMAIGRAFVQRGILDELPIILDINHDPLGDTEDIDGPYEVIASFDHTNSLDSVQMFYRFGEDPDFITEDMEPTGNEDEYSSEIPGPGEQTDVYYFIKVVDDMGLVSFAPPGAPGASYEFFAGPDTVAPVIDHEPLEDLPETGWPAQVSAGVSDNIAVDSVWLEFRINGGSFETVSLAYNEDDSLWHGEFSGSAEGGDQVDYRLKARDASSNGNIAYLPDDGYFSFDILDILTVTYMVDESFPIPDDDFSGVLDTIFVAEDFEIYEVDVYVDITHPYVGDLLFFIRDPESVSTFLHNRSGEDDDDIVGWYDDDIPPDGPGDMTRFVGHQSQGRWIFYVSDRAEDNTGTLNNWGIRIRGTGEPTGTEEQDISLPQVLTLNQNYPNPFNPSTNLSFFLPQAGIAKLEIFDLLGRRVATPIDGLMSAGEHLVVWDGRAGNGERVSSGIYFAKLTLGNERAVIRMSLLK